MAWFALGAAAAGVFLPGIITGLVRHETVPCYKCKVELLKTSNHQTEEKNLAGETVTVTTYHSEDGEVYYYTKKVGSSLLSFLSESQYICSDCFLEVLWILQMRLFDSSILNGKSKRLQFLEWMYEFRGGFIAHTEPYYQLASFTGGINSLSPSVSSKSDPESFSMLPVLPLSRQELTYSNSGSDSSSEDDEEEHVEVQYGGAWKSFSSVLDEVIKLHSSGYVTADGDLQSAYQACFISCYAAAYDLDDCQIEVLLEEVNYIGCGLSSFDFFKLTKAMGIMCKNVFSSPKLISFNDVSQFYFDLIRASDLGGCYATTNICLREFLKRGSTVMCSEELQTLIVETLVSSPWTSEEVLKLFFTISHDLQSFGEILQLVKRYQIPFGDIELKQEPKYLLKTLERKYDSDTSKRLKEVMDNLSKSELLDHNTLLLTGKIVRKVLETPLTLTGNDAVRILENEESDLEQRIEANAAVIGIVYHSVCFIIGKKPTVTQLVSVCILLVSHQEKVKRLLEVLTGEGKSLIIAMFAAALALLDKKVDILTSTPDLAQRDVEIFQKFYQFLGLTVSHNTETEEILDMRPAEADKERLAIYRSDIVYGTVNDFSGDLLRQEFEMRNVRGYRKMDVAIVDEMDMLMLDKGMQFTYLSHHSAIMHHVEPVLALVWSNVRQTTPFITTSGKTLFAGIPKFIHDVIFEGLKAGLRSRIGDSRKILQAAANGDFIDKAVLHTILQNVFPVMKKSAMSQFRTASMIQFVKYLQMEYIPCNIAVYISNSTGELVRQDCDESFDRSGTIPEFSLLILDEGLACPLYTQSKLANGILRMVAVQCDLPLKGNMNPEKTLKTVEGKEFYEGQTNFFHDVIFRCMLRLHEPKFSSAEKMLYLAVKYNLLSDSQVSRFIFARDKAEQNELMKNLTTLHLTAFIYELNKELPLRIVPYTLDSNQTLAVGGPSFLSSVKEVVLDDASIPVLVRDKGILQPLYPYEWVDGASSTSYCTKNGTRFWLGDCKFFHECLFHCLQSEHMLFLAGKLDLISKYDIKQFFLAKDHRSKQNMALQNVSKEQILELMKYLEATLPYKFIIYTFEDGDIQMASKLDSDETNKTGPVLLINGPGTMCQLQPKETVDIPGFLQQFLVNQLPTYIQSAFTALLMTEEREYMVKNARIVPIDFKASGLIETNKRWGGGLQQMLEMKHLLKLTPISITTNFISHLYFFAQYNSLYGLSGTVGLKCEQDALNA